MKKFILFSAVILLSFVAVLSSCSSEEDVVTKSDTITLQ